ncbi:Maf-like protein [Scheffersomyces coipomensis]|uniref:Maf-like protein n=1 Tax=Scheffersomyces coipomensis TaxID=1788519 RepID=UPI00315CB86C
MFNHQLYDKLNQFKFILGSTSPRRLESLQQNLNIQHDQIHIKPSHFKEDLNHDDYNENDYVITTSLLKGEYILKELQQEEKQDMIILTCDTIIKCNNEIFEKPETKQNQRIMFDKYKAHPHIQVISATTIIKVHDSRVTTYQDTEITDLTFNTEDSDDIIDAYINSEEGLHVAGGFKFQQLGSLLFSSINGDYFNIVGLPVLKTFKLLEKALK